MPGYRGPDLARQQQQMAANHYAYAGQSVTWRAYVSASGGVAVAGLGATGYYREMPISALFRPLPSLPETQTPAGMIAAGQFEMTTREQVGRGDEIVWAGTVYRVEGAPVPATMHSGYVSLVARAEV
jgi:hypothetical protein